MKIPTDHGHLEAALRDPEGDPVGGAVFCHPHPLQGGTMHTKAVYRACEALNDVGLRTLRFNFRGVGWSTGSFDDGIGEREDVQAALAWLKLGLGKKPVVVGGMSFGSLVGLGAAMDDEAVTGMVAIGVPIHMYDYGFLAGSRQPILVVQGEKDEFGPAEEVRQVFGGLGSHITVREVKGAGHLFQGHMAELQDQIREYFAEGPGAQALEGKEPSTGKVEL